MTAPSTQEQALPASKDEVAAFLAADRVDRLLLYRAPILIGDGRRSLGALARGLAAVLDGRIQQRHAHHQPGTEAAAVRVACTAAGHAQQGAAPADPACRQTATRVQAHMPAHQRDKQHVGAGRCLRQGNRRRELGVAQPALLVHQVAVHVGGGGDGAAHAQQRQRGKVGEQLQPVGEGGCHAQGRTEGVTRPSTR